MTDLYTELCNNAKRAKILDNRKYTTENNPNTYDIICPFCKTCVSYSNFRNHESKSKKHSISRTIWYNQNTTECDPENVLQIG